MTAVTAFS